MKFNVMFAKFLGILALVSCSLTLVAQTDFTNNVIMNGSFEMNSGIPLDQNEMYKCDHWAPFGDKTSDYYSTEEGGFTEIY